jgi:hypothetical protein
VIPSAAGSRLQELAGPASRLARTHGVHLQHVTVASLPDRYEERLAPLWPGRFARLALFTVEPHDLALSKLARNSPIDREDVARLARAVPLDPVSVSATRPNCDRSSLATSRGMIGRSSSG